MTHMKYILFILSVLVVSANAQVNGYSMHMGQGWYTHQFSDGSFGYSMPMGAGWANHSFSDGTSYYTMPLDRQQHSYGIHAPAGAIHVPELEIAPLNLAPFNY